MTPVKANFSSMYEDTTCKNCDLNVPQSDSHLLECTKMIEECQALYDDDKTRASFKDLGHVLVRTSIEIVMSYFWKNRIFIEILCLNSS